MFKYFFLKIISVIPFCYFQFTQDNKNIMWGIIFIVIIDTILGIWVAVKNRTFRSSKLRGFAYKVGQYGLAMASVWIISAVEPQLFGWVFRYVGLFIIVTEILSNFEKLSLLGFEIPTAFIAKLNDNYKKLSDLKGAKRKTEVKRIIE